MTIRIESTNNVIYTSKAPENKEDYKYIGSGVWMLKGKEIIGIYSQPSSDEFMKRIKDVPKPERKK